MERFGFIEKLLLKLTMEIEQMKQLESIPDSQWVGNSHVLKTLHNNWGKTRGLIVYRIEHVGIYIF